MPLEKFKLLFVTEEMLKFPVIVDTALNQMNIFFAGMSSPVNGGIVMLGKVFLSGLKSSR